MGKGALAVVFGEVRAELEAMESDPLRAELARRVREATVRVEETLQSLYSDIDYALLRAKLVAEMAIEVITATELLGQAGADPSRIDIAEAFVRRRLLDVEHKAHRIEANVEGRLERDARIVARVTTAGVA